MNLKPLSSWEGYPEECGHASGQCEGHAKPFMGERDSMGYEVIGLCTFHTNALQGASDQCDWCGNICGSVGPRQSWDSSDIYHICSRCHHEHSLSVEC
jgi:hypothetical protein